MSWSCISSCRKYKVLHSFGKRRPVEWIVRTNHTKPLLRLKWLELAIMYDLDHCSPLYLNIVLEWCPMCKPSCAVCKLGWYSHRENRTDQRIQSIGLWDRLVHPNIICLLIEIPCPCSSLLLLLVWMQIKIGLARRLHTTPAVQVQGYPVA